MSPARRNTHDPSHPSSPLLHDIVEELKPEFAAMSDAIWDYAELSFREHQSAATQVAMLEKHGFRITRGTADIETAFTGEAGAGEPGHCPSR